MRDLKLCRVTTIPLSLAILLEGQLEYLKVRGFDITAVSSPDAVLDRIAEQSALKTVGVKMLRTISPVSDFKALIKLYFLFRKERFNIVHSHTPKAGLLSMIAAWAAKIPLRIHTFAGTAPDFEKSLKWALVKRSDRLTALFSTHCLAISKSLLEVLIRRHVCPAKKIRVLLSGSSNGIDLKRFSPTSQVAERGRKLRTQLGIPPDANVIAFVGRVVRDKGVMELVQAFRRLDHPNLHLVLVGPWESELDPLPDEIVEEVNTNHRIHSVGFQCDVEAYLAMSTLLAVPTYREGFGNVFIQAAAMERPCVGTKIPGVLDSVKEGVSGILVEPRDVEGLAKALDDLLSSSERRDWMGKEGRRWVEENFCRDKMWEALERMYLEERRKMRGEGNGV